MMNTSIDIAAFDRVFSLLTDCLKPDTAQKIVDLRITPEQQARIDHLAVKANDDDLCAEERREYRAYVETIDLIGLVQAKAKFILARSTLSQ